MSKLRNTEINWYVPPSPIGDRDERYGQLVIPHKAIKSIVHDRVFEVRTGYNRDLKARFIKNRFKVVLNVELEPGEEMQYGLSTAPFDFQLEPKDSYTILDWLEITKQ